MEKLTLVHRQGDMGIYRVDSGTLNKKTEDGYSLHSLVIGLGERSGHEHVVFPMEGGELLMERDVTVTKEDLANMDRLLFEVTGPGALIAHEDHDPNYLEPGLYVRLNQVEINPYTSELEKVRD